MKTWSSRLLSLFALICAFFVLPSYAQLSATWTQMNAPAGPSQRGWVDTIYDSTIGEHALFGGSGEFYFNDVWTYSLASNRWLQLEPNVNITGVSPPCRRDEHSVEFDARNRLYFSFGGTGFNCG